MAIKYSSALTMFRVGLLNLKKRNNIFLGTCYCLFTAMTNTAGNDNNDNKGLEMRRVSSPRYVFCFTFTLIVILSI